MVGQDGRFWQVLPPLQPSLRQVTCSMATQRAGRVRRIASGALTRTRKGRCARPSMRRSIRVQMRSKRNQEPGWSATSEQVSWKAIIVKSLTQRKTEAKQKAQQLIRVWLPIMMEMRRIQKRRKKDIRERGSGNIVTLGKARVGMRRRRNWATISQRRRVSWSAKASSTFKRSLRCIRRPCCSRCASNTTRSAVKPT